MLILATPKVSTIRSRVQDKILRVMKKETPHSGSLPASGERGQADPERHILSPIYISPARWGGEEFCLTPTANIWMVNQPVRAFPPICEKLKPAVVFPQNSENLLSLLRSRHTTFPSLEILRWTVLASPH